jgi:hypothetical protein
MRSFNINIRFIELLLVTIVLFFSISITFAQPELPRRSVTVTATQAINFGRLCVWGSGGTVTLGYDGNRTSSGEIALLTSVTAQPAIFEIKLCEGRNVIITFDATTTLTGSNGGSLILDLGPTDKGSNGASFSTNSDCNFITPLRLGGKLHLPGTSIPGSYTGSFAITLNQQ